MRAKRKSRLDEIISPALQDELNSLETSPHANPLYDPVKDESTSFLDIVSETVPIEQEEKKPVMSKLFWVFTLVALLGLVLMGYVVYTQFLEI